MRQRLISKQHAKGAEPQSKEKAMLRAGLVTEVQAPSSSLSRLLFGNLKKKEWKKELKKHSEAVAEYLLNEDYDGFADYLRESGESLSTMDIDVKQSDLAQLDYKPVLQDLLQTAILIEHSTIPPYLTALYSIKEGTNAFASQVIRSIAVEEMLHMIMVCNVMNAVDIQPSVNAPQNYPSYPAKLPLNVDFYVNLEKFSPNSISTFIAIESPSSPVVEAPDEKKSGLPEMELFKTVMAQKESNWSPDILNSFIKKHLKTIGEFYDFVFFFIVVFQVMAYYREHGSWPTSFEDINTGGIFTGDKEKQIRPDEYYGSGGTLYSVASLEGVINVFQEIKGQGEGADGAIYSTDPSQFEEGFEPAHYFRFKEIFHEHTYAHGDYKAFTDKDGMMPVTTPPTGKELPVDWSAVYPIKTNLKMKDLDSNSPLYAQVKAFNKTYKSLLDAIQAAVEGDHDQLAKSIMIMYALKEQAVELMRQPYTEQENAAPTFEYVS